MEGEGKCLLIKHLYFLKLCFGTFGTCTNVMLGLSRYLGLYLNTQTLTFVDTNIKISFELYLNHFCYGFASKRRYGD